MAELIVALEPREDSVVRGVVVSVFGVLALGVAMTERAHEKHVRGVALVLGAVLLLAGLRVVVRIIAHNKRVRTQPMRVRMDAHTFFFEPAVGTEPATYKASLADFQRGVLRTVGMRPHSLLGERRADGTPIVLLEYGYTPRGVTYEELLKEINRRALLARSGVTSGDEMRAAEAFMTFAAVDAPMFGIGVSNRPSELWALESAADVAAAAAENLTVYVPAASLAAGPGGDSIRTLHLPSLAEYVPIVTGRAGVRTS